ncbi:SCP2 sterol-binding domain-containing protein [Oceanimonas sp. CHS3-5]|uniref:ubiquinone biosynthesis accessory factor UbiJ n=1 Tax=Oceanimonas sp. CHS3-5 TaxID=3068186 RepID=UPI00273F9B67|nr:SCP2 sterol-binding domain-containing protein [Oceanimonas sp. CHS3-5]MDP5293838.1 SCP2 sterol-binding domain-containing protein [Oceanimonas sp. CHS3-5]
MKALLLPLLNGTLETAINRLLQGTGGAQKLKPLNGRVLQLTLTELASFYLIFIDGRLELLGHYEGRVDSHLSLSLNALGLLKDKGLLMQYIRDGRLDLEGDPQPWQYLSTQLRDTPVDLEEWLVPYTGDALAHLLCRHGREAKASLSQRLSGAQQHLGDYVREEARLAVGSLELADFGDEVEELSKRLNRLQGRLAALTDKVTHS